MRLILETFAMAGGLGVGILLPSNVMPQTADPLPVDATLAQSGKATPYGFKGKHSPNLNHLVKMAKERQPAPSPSPTTTATVKTKSKTVPATAKDVAVTPEYLAEFSTLQRTCPALAGQDAATFRPDEWFTRRVPEKELRNMPREFLEAAYHTIALSPEGSRKIAALTMLNKAIPDSPAYISYINQKRSDLEQILDSDPAVQSMRTNWLSMTPQTKQEALAHISRTTLGILLPANEIDQPRLLYLTRNLISKLGYGLYHGEFNESYIDGTDKAIKSDANFAIQITIHETFHTFEGILAAWYKAGKLSRNADLQRQGKLYYLGSIEGGSHITAEESGEGYRTSFGERGSWAFQLASANLKSVSIQDDMFLLRSQQGEVIRQIAAPPAYKQDAKAGTLPAACLTHD